MLITKRRSPQLNLLLFLCLLTLVPSARAQRQNQTPQAQDDVVRVKTELVQTDVTVVDKRGRVVTGLKPDQFELRVDSRPQPLAFFEEVVAGSPEEEKKIAAARQIEKVELKESSDAAARGRLVFFFVDDLHLTGESLTRARSLLLHFVADKMAANDRVAIISASGQIGFLQQLTTNKAVLREAISRLNAKINPETTASQVHISEVDANLVANHSDRGLFNYLVTLTMKEFQMQSPLSAMTLVKNRVNQINAQAKSNELETLSRLAGLIRSTAPLSGRKIIFFVSDGFVVDIKRSNGAEVMQRIGREAAGAGAVVYSLGTRANVFGPGADVSRNDYPDYNGGTAWRSIVESKAPQEPLETLADETGGRSYLNSSALEDGVTQALTETSAYYLLVWRPATESQVSGKSRIEATIKDRPDLRVRMRRHFFDLPRPEAVKTGTGLAATAEDELRMTLGALYPRKELPTAVATSVVTTDKGSILNVSMQIDSGVLNFEDNRAAVVDVLGIALDDRGKFVSFKQKLDIPLEAVKTSGRFVKWNQVLTLPPGLYQVRVAVRERQNGRTGSAMDWVEIPSAPARDNR